MNLLFSSIEVKDRTQVIQVCYWPLLGLADKGFKIGIELTGHTLELIETLDPIWVAKFRSLLKEGKAELIGSGYSQIIGPLVPASVNDWNQNLGLSAYEKLLGVQPAIALVNEMAYSSGLVEHYLNNGYKAIVMEWNNPRVGHPEWDNDWRYFHQKAVGRDGRNIGLIWADSIAFQKFQRFVHDELEMLEYVQYILSHNGEIDHYFPLYTNDIEIFDFRPGRYKTENEINAKSEWERIIDLYQHLDKQDWCEFSFPAQVLNGNNSLGSSQELVLESPAQPIPVKKQEKYNINRWALSGRDDLRINTICYQIYEALTNEDNQEWEDWKDLCFLWSSDFRTHITKKRWDDYQGHLINTSQKWNNSNVKVPFKNGKRAIRDDHRYFIQEGARLLTIEDSKMRLVLNKQKGIAIKECIFKNVSGKSLFGTLEHGYYDDISLGADFYSGHTTIERMGQHKITDLNKVQAEVINGTHQIIVQANQDLENVHFSNEITLNSASLSLKKTIRFQGLDQMIFRPISFTLNPEAWDKDSIYYETHNGGMRSDKFMLAEKQVIHNDIYSSLISARHGLGNTEGKLSIGDKDKKITFFCDMTISALIPTIAFYPLENDKYFLRLQYSAQELDETSKPHTDTRNILSFIRIVAEQSKKVLN